MAFGRDDRKQIAVVTYPGLTLLELVGAVSVLDGLRLDTGFQPVTVGASRDPVVTDTPARLVPQSTFTEVSRPFAVLVPGGSGLGAIMAMGDEKLLAYIRAAADGAELVASVGAGSLLLASARLLQGKQATTHWMYKRILENLGVAYMERRWVEDGKYATAAGSSGGIDMALALVARHKGERFARRVQLWIEYDPQPPFGPLDQRARHEDPLASVLAEHETDWRQALAHRPDLLDAVERAAYPVAQTENSLERT